MNQPTQAERERLVRDALALDARLVQCLADWVGRDLSGYDWQCGLPWRIENQIASLLKEINQDLGNRHED